jgi:hypothetical protein
MWGSVAQPLRFEWEVGPLTTVENSEKLSDQHR